MAIKKEDFRAAPPKVLFRYSVKYSQVNLQPPEENPVQPQNFSPVSCLVLMTMGLPHFGHLGLKSHFLKLEQLQNFFSSVFLVYSFIGEPHFGHIKSLSEVLFGHFKAADGAAFLATTACGGTAELSGFGDAAVCEIGLGSLF